MGLDHARAEEADVVVEEIGVDGGRGELLGAIAVAAKAGAVAGGVSDGLDAGALLSDAGVEGRVDIDELDAGAAEIAQCGEIFASDDAVWDAGLDASLDAIQWLLRGKSITECG